MSRPVAGGYADGVDDQQPVPLTKSPPERPVPSAPAGPADTDLRASDADRDRIADILRDAFAEGRLTPEEHAERIDAVYRARTQGELRPLVRDLPASVRPLPGPVPSGLPSAPAAGPATETLAAVFGGAVRKGRWRVTPRTRAVALFGGVEIDLTEAVFEQQEVVIDVFAAFGGVEVKVAENVSVRGAGTGIFGGFDVSDQEAVDPDAPVIVVRGLALFGGVEVRPVKGKRLRNLRAG
ncbi:DUF1707 SHOCT-like domain-containing protein [Streptomyces pactum]|uniref:DUF1707 SHOCT-like domain-containing protein n=1 Tax=Streptomyces pactum TaxID=68249 RepID=UPI0036F7897A